MRYQRSNTHNASWRHDHNTIHNHCETLCHAISLRKTSLLVSRTSLLVSRTTLLVPRTRLIPQKEDRAAHRVPCDIPQGDESGCPEDDFGCPEDDSGCPGDDSGCSPTPRRNTGKRRGRRWYLSPSTDSSCGNSRFFLTHITNLRFGARTYLTLCAMTSWGVMTSSGVMGIQSQSIDRGREAMELITSTDLISSQHNETDGTDGTDGTGGTDGTDGSHLKRQ